MPASYANDFTEIPATLAGNTELRSAMLSLVATQLIAGKVTEGDDRLTAFRSILSEMIAGSINVFQAIRRVEADLPRSRAVHPCRQ